MLFLMMLWLLAVHWVADFVCQTHWQSINKSKSNEALGRHVATYTLVLAGGSIFILGYYAAAFALVNGVLHFVTDYFTSRWASRLYAKQDWHNFFVVIGLDQLIHHMTLAATLWLFIVNA